MQMEEIIVKAYIIMRSSYNCKNKLVKPPRKL